jgi:steroid delta-isomerase-like uncharacterized protein
MTTKMNAQETLDGVQKAWNSHSPERLLRFYRTDARVFDPSYPEPLTDAAAIEKDAADFVSAFPDLTFEVDRVLEGGGALALEGSATGTHTGPWQFPTGLVPATNRRIRFNWMASYKIDGEGLIQEERRYYDVAGVLQQLGLMQ